MTMSHKVLLAVSRHVDPSMRKKVLLKCASAKKSPFAAEFVRRTLSVTVGLLDIELETSLPHIAYLISHVI